MNHTLVMGVFDEPAAAAAAARELRALGVAREDVSIVAQSQEEEASLVEATGASPGAEIEDSRIAGRLGELGAYVVAAVAVIMPGLGPVVTAGPLAAEFGEAAGHAAGGIARTLEAAGLPALNAQEWEARVAQGGVLVAAHVNTETAEAVEEVIRRNRAERVGRGTWRSQVTN